MNKRHYEHTLPNIRGSLSNTYGITCGGEAVEHILETYSYLIGEERKVIELANEAGDDATADLMTGYLKEQEKMVWMLVAFSTKSCAK